MRCQGERVRERGSKSGSSSSGSGGTSGSGSSSSSGSGSNAAATDDRAALDNEAEESGKPRLLLSAAVPVGPDNVRGGYDVPAVAKALDFINLMAYDFHGKWESQAGHNAPLYAPSSDSEWRKQLSVEFAARMWTRLGS